MKLFSHRPNVDLERPHFRRNLRRVKLKAKGTGLFGPKCLEGWEGGSPRAGSKRSFSCPHHSVLFFFTAFVTTCTVAEVPSNHLFLYFMSALSRTFWFSFGDTATPPLSVYVAQWAWLSLQLQEWAWAPGLHQSVFCIPLATGIALNVAMSPQSDKKESRPVQIRPVGETEHLPAGLERTGRKPWAVSARAWEELFIWSFTTKRKQKTGPDPIERLDPAIPEVSGLLRSMLPKPVWVVCYLPLRGLYFFIHFSLATHYSSTTSNSSVSRSYISRPDIYSEVGYKSTACSKPKQLMKGGKGQSIFSMISNIWMFVNKETELLVFHLIVSGFC